MDLEQRFTGDDYYYELEEVFLEHLEELPVRQAASIIMQLDHFVNETRLKSKAGLVAGVVESKDPLFFAAEYLSYKDSWPIFHKLNIIDSDDYLDYMNLNKIINKIKTKR